MPPLPCKIGLIASLALNVEIPLIIALNYTTRIPF